LPPNARSARKTAEENKTENAFERLRVAGYL
jgi:hypothetical protein